MNLQAVARRAKVSTATVSRVINNLDVVRPATRQRVAKAMQDLNYHPNPHARTLAGGKSRTIGMIASNMENPFFFDIFQTLEEDAHANGYEVVVANTGYQPGKLLSSVRMMISRRVAGLAVIVSEMDPALMHELQASKIPAVFYDVGSAGRHITSIKVNYQRGIELLVEHLYSLGHRRMAFIGHDSALGPTSDRERAFKAALARHSKKLKSVVANSIDGLDGGRQAMRDLLATGFNPTAVVCVNDFMAAGALRELRDRGLRVPHEISVTGYDNIKLSEYCFPELTTVDIPRVKIGHIVFESLAGAQGREIVLDPELVIRTSTGPIPASIKIR